MTFNLLLTVAVSVQVKLNKLSAQTLCQFCLIYKKALPALRKSKKR